MTRAARHLVARVEREVHTVAQLFERLYPITDNLYKTAHELRTAAHDLRAGKTRAGVSRRTTTRVRRRERATR